MCSNIHCLHTVGFSYHHDNYRLYFSCLSLPFSRPAHGFYTFLIQLFKLQIWRIDSENPVTYLPVSVRHQRDSTLYVCIPAICGKYEH